MSNFPIFITAKRKNPKTGTVHVSVNGMKIKGHEEQVKNSLKLLKLTGFTDPNMLNYASFEPMITSKLRTTELPEWDAPLFKMPT